MKKPKLTIYLPSELLEQLDRLTAREDGLRARYGLKTWFISELIRLSLEAFESRNYTVDLEPLWKHLDPYTGDPE